MIIRIKLICRLKYVLCWILSLLPLLTGCSVRHFPDYPVQPVDQYRYTAVKDGLAVSIHPILKTPESQQYFGTDLLSLNTLAVFIVAENRSDSSSFIISKDRFLLGDEASRNKIDQDRSQIGNDTAANGVQMAGAICILAAPVAAIALIPVGAKMASDAAMVQHNFATKELQVHTLSPGKSIHGFVYFSVTEKDQVEKRLTLHFEAPERPSNTVKHFDIPFTMN